MQPRHVTVGDITIGNDLPMVFIIGPNVMESRAHALEMSAALAELAKKLGIALIYKTSFDKANRSSIFGARGIGLEAGLPILAEVKETTGLPLLTDIHAPEQCARFQVGKLCLNAARHDSDELVYMEGHSLIRPRLK